MDESVDKKLAARFKEVFDGHEDGGSAEGWALLQQKRQRAKPVPFYWLSGAAALLLLAAGLFWLYPSTENTTQKKHGQLAMKKSVQKKPSADAGHTVNNKTGAEKYTAKEAPDISSGETGRWLRSSAAERATNKAAQTGNKSPWRSNSLTKARYEEYLTALSAMGPPQTMTGRSDVRIANIIPEANPGDMFVRQNSALKEAYPKTKKSSAADRRAFALSVYAGSQVGYGVQNTRNQARPSAGVTAEYALGKSKRFSVGVGAGYADYQLAYNKGLPPISGGAKSSAAAMNDARILAYAAQSPSRKRTPSFVNGNSLSNPALNTYSFVSASSVDVERVTASFSTVDIPVSVSWQALTGKTGLSLSAAINSTWMMREAYTASISVSNFRGAVTQTRMERNEQNFTAFTPFSAAQLSVGVSPGGIKSRFTIEPFARFPLQSQGIEQLRYGAGGVNIKFRLNGIQNRVTHVQPQ